MSDSATDATRDSYYGRPILKAPVWKWEIPVYFFFGGMAGAAAPFALLSDCAATRRSRAGPGSWPWPARRPARAPGR